jgi:hypothetical protein
MSKTKAEPVIDKPAAATPTVRHRVVVPIQTRGGIGKSTEAIARASWMDQRGVNWQGFDLDAQNRTFSDNFPSQAALVQLAQNEPEGDIIRLLRKSTLKEVTAIDPQAHMNLTILQALNLIQFPKQSAAAGVRLTVLVYPMDEVTDMDDITSTVDALGDTVDWVIVRNPARQPRTRMFDGSGIEAELKGFGAATMILPALLTDTRMALRNLEVQHGRAINPVEALANRALKFDMAHRMVLEDWTKRAFQAFDEIAPHLLPTEKGAEVQASHKRPAAPAPETRRRGRSVNLANLD